MRRRSSSLAGLGGVPSICDGAFHALGSTRCPTSTIRLGNTVASSRNQPAFQHFRRSEKGQRRFGPQQARDSLAHSARLTPDFSGGVSSILKFERIQHAEDRFRACMVLGRKVLGTHRGRQPKLLSFHPSHTIVMSCDALLYEDVNVSDK
jgi:hypothetical protein